jgi:undecaprenyl-diphosphatase
MNFLLQLDQKLFLAVNGLHSPLFDFLMYWASDKFIWLPLYAFLLFLMLRKYRRQPWMLILAIALLVTLTDQISVKLFKDVFERLRPCHEPALEGLVRTLYGQCGGKYGFVSSHAANTFGIALFAGLALKTVQRRALAWLLLWAALVSYSRIYLGVHYPADVIAGGLTGACIGWLVYLIFARLRNSTAPESGSNP